MTGPTSWLPPPPDLRLAEEEVHVWRVDLTALQMQAQRLCALLEPEERDRARRLRFDRDRERFIVAHGALRETLACYVGHDPAQLRFRRDRGGKPALAGMAGSLLRFNLSHSENLALIALARQEVGVDVEKIRDIDLDLARRYFSSAEVDVLTSLSAEEQLSAFFSCWTRKEAYIKATGHGLSIPLDSFTVSCGEPAALLAPPDSAWTLHSLHPAPGYTGAVAVDGAVADIRCWEYQGFGQRPFRGDEQS